MSRLEKLVLPVVLISLFVCSVTRGATSSVSLTWNPSTDPSVIGYNVYYGGANGVYTEMISMGNTTNAAVTGLADGDTYCFAVTAYDAYGDESAFSNQISYIVPGVLTATPGTTPGGALAIHFPVAPGQQYQLQASQDLQSWSTIWQGLAVSNAWLEFDDPQTSLPQRFYRLLFN